MKPATKITRVALLGGSGFVGSHITAKLRNRGIGCRVITRHAHRHAELRTIAEIVEADAFDHASMTKALDGCDAVINLVGILNGSPQGFRRVHVELVEHLAEACRETRIRRLLHMSALNADQASGSSQYLRSKGEGENAAHTLGKPYYDVTSFRPSVIFGANDGLLNRFATLLSLPGPLPLACPDAKLSPVYVGDVATAFANALSDPATFGKRYELCGPRVYSLEELVRAIARYSRRETLILRMPDWASRLQAKLLQYAPGQPFTPDNYLSLQTPSVCKQNGLAALGITPVSLDNVGADLLAGSARSKRFERWRRER